jgi:hypothetical protein
MNNEEFITKLTSSYRRWINEDEIGYKTFFVEVAKRSKKYRDDVRARAWESISTKEKTRPSIAVILEHLNKSLPTHSPKSRVGPSDRAIFNSDGFKVSLNNFCAADFHMACIQQKRILTEGEVEEIARRNEKAKQWAMDNEHRIKSCKSLPSGLVDGFLSGEREKRFRERYHL